MCNKIHEHKRGKISPLGGPYSAQEKAPRVVNMHGEEGVHVRGRNQQPDNYTIVGSHIIV